MSIKQHMPKICPDCGSSVGGAMFSILVARADCGRHVVGLPMTGEWKWGSRTRACYKAVRERKARGKRKGSKR